MNIALKIVIKVLNSMTHLIQNWKTPLSPAGYVAWPMKNPLKFMFHRFGRIPTMMALIIFNAFFGTLSAFTPYYGLFLICVWACGFGAIGFGTVIYCWMMEMLSGREKTIFGCAPNYNFSLWWSSSANSSLIWL